ncbi:hypothetical protein Tco_1401331 [Tanacetum coccineum]
MQGGKKRFDGLGMLGAEDDHIIMTPFKASALNVDFDLKIDLIVFGLEISSTPSNFFSGGRGILRLCFMYPLHHQDYLEKLGPIEEEKKAVDRGVAETKDLSRDSESGRDGGERLGGSGK